MHTQSTFPVSSLNLCSETLSINIASIDIEHLCEVCSLVVSVWDEDLLRPDDLIGVFTIPMKNIINYYRISISSNYFFYMTTEVSGTYVFWHINHMYVCMYCIFDIKVCMYSVCIEAYSEAWVYKIFCACMYVRTYFHTTSIHPYYDVTRLPFQRAAAE